MSEDEAELAGRLITVLKDAGLAVDSSAWMRYPPQSQIEPPQKPPRESYVQVLKRLSRKNKPEESKKPHTPKPSEDPYVLPPGHSALCIPHTGQLGDVKEFSMELQERVRAEVHNVLWVHVSNRHVFVSAHTPKPLRILNKTHELLH